MGSEGGKRIWVLHSDINFVEVEARLLAAFSSLGVASNNAGIAVADFSVHIAPIDVPPDLDLEVNRISYQVGGANKKGKRRKDWN